MNVLSLFDGISCAMVGLEKANVKVDKYFSSEIDKHSIAISQNNHPEIIQLGDVRNINMAELPKIDLLIGGTPCQNLSKININNEDHNQGLSGNKSVLFYEYLRILKQVNPKYFILENVDMNLEDADIITKTLNVNPVCINTSSFLAQDRPRLWWSNIKIKEPERDCNLVIKDIMQQEVAEKHYYKKDFEFLGENKRVIAKLKVNCHDMGKRVYNINYKSPTLTGVTGGYHEKKIFHNGRCRKLTPIEYERLMGLEDNYTKGIIDSKRLNAIGNAFSPNIIEYIIKHI
jgi:DNA-cytosine methyltransferase